jgi:D-sedoheptulose 7-phosphate isomerase
MGKASLGLAQSEIEEAADCFAELLKVQDRVSREILDMAHVGADVLRGGGCLFFAGNGGSFADAQHMAAEFTGKLSRPRAPLSAAVLGANGSSISAIGNDFAYDEVFSREFEALSKGNDMVIAFSTSGSSGNIVRLAESASKVGVPFYCFTGAASSPLEEIGTVIRVPSLRTERIQEMHTMLGHLFCLLVEEELDIF